MELIKSTPVGTAASELKKAKSQASAAQGAFADKTPLPSNHTWTRSSVAYVLRELGGKPGDRTVTIDLSALDLPSHCFLRDVLKAAKFPLHNGYAYGMRYAIEALSKHANTVEILRRPSPEVSIADVRTLFETIESAISTKLGIDQLHYSFSSRYLFTQYSGKIAEGEKVKNCGFSSKFKGNSRRLQQGRDLAGPKGRAAPPTVTSDFDSLEERDKKSLALVETQAAEIRSICEKSLNEHEQVQHIIRTARDEGLPLQSRKLTCSKLLKGRKPSGVTLRAIKDPNDSLRIAVFLMDKESWHTQGRLGFFPLIRLSQLAPYCEEPNANQIGELMLSESYMPRLTITACTVIIALATALNAGVIALLTLSNVVETDSSIMLVGLKARSAQLVNAEVSDATEKSESGNEDVVEGVPDEIKIKDSLCAKALRLLIENAKRLKNAFGLDDIILTTCLSLKTRKPKLMSFNFYKAGAHFWKYHNSHHISARDLRRLAAHIDLLSPNGSVYTVQTLLGHANVKTTYAYINTNIVNRLLDANMMRFMKKLAASLLFATGRTGLLIEHGLSEKDVQPKLFPISDMSGRTSKVDAWLSSNGAMKLNIGMAELRHCAVQYNFYKRNFTRLCNENPHRFSSVHLPRILFCFALRKVILASQHSALLVNYEAGLK